MSFRVTVLPRARQDIEDTYNFISREQQQPLAAQRWVEGIEECIQSLSSLAQAGDD